MSQKKAMLIDLTLCMGCNACQAACKEENHLSPNEEKNLSLTAYTALNKYSDVYVRRLCQHCDVPTCVSVCPVGALVKQGDGPVAYDADKCIGCRYCLQACPYHVPKYEWSSTKPRIQKCRFCAPRLAKGQLPACAEACPVGATLFGDRDELQLEAARRLGAEPTKYVPRIYGKDDVGGTSMFYLSSVPFEQLGFDSRLGRVPLPMLTMSALSKVPNVLSVGGVVLGGIWWITNRRTEVAAFEAAEKKGETPRPEEKP